MSIDEHGVNGKDAIAVVEGHYQSARRGRASFDHETNERRAYYLNAMASLLDERKEAMIMASTHAGAIGLIYHASSNSFARVIVPNDIPVVDTVETPPKGVAALEEKPSEDQSETGQESSSIVPQAEESVEPTAMVVEALPSRPKPPRMEDFSLRDLSSHGRIQPVLDAAKSTLPWLLSAPIGAFIGFGIVNLVGIPYQRPGQQGVLWFGLGLGIAAVWTIKWLFSLIWDHVGYTKLRGERTLGYVLVGILVTTVFLAVEAALGGIAISIYSEKTSLKGIAMPLWQCVGISMAISSATLLISAVLGYLKGTSRGRAEVEGDRKLVVDSPRYDRALQEYKEELAAYQKQMDRREEAAFEIRKREQELADRKHHSELAELERAEARKQLEFDSWKNRQEAYTREFESAVQGYDDRLTDLESAKKVPDFQALCKYVGVVEVLNQRLEELQREYTNEMISRGHNRKYAI